MEKKNSGKYWRKKTMYMKYITTYMFVYGVCVVMKIIIFITDWFRIHDSASTQFITRGYGKTNMGLSAQQSNLYINYYYVSARFRNMIHTAQ